MRIASFVRIAVDTSMTTQESFIIRFTGWINETFKIMALSEMVKYYILGMLHHICGGGEHLWNLEGQSTLRKRQSYT